MTQTNTSASQPSLSLGKRMLIGAIFGLMIMAVFVLPVEGRPEWGNFWKIRPVLVESFAGAMAGLCNYILLHYRGLIGLNKTVAIIISVIVSFVGLWMGFVLGLNGTLWN